MTTPANPIRRLEPVSVSGLKPHPPTTGQPIVEYVNPRSLYVDPAYQRAIGERGMRQIRKIIEGFDWSKYKLPTCSYSQNVAGETVLFVIDGQHTAIACASHPDISEIPVAIIEGTLSVQSQAEAFIGLNRDRLNVTPLQLHQAAVTAADPEAVTIENVCANAGITVLRNTPGSGRFQPRQTIAIAALGQMIARRGAMRARQILDVLARTQLAPITLHHIKAAELLMTDNEFRDQIAGDDLSIAIDAMIGTADDEAKAFAKTHRQPQWKALASVWFRKCRKRRAGSAQSAKGAAAPAPAQAARRPSATTHRTIVPHAMPTARNVTGSMMGDPEPGRSALDHRRPA